MLNKNTGKGGQKSFGGKKEAPLCSGKGKGGGSGAGRCKKGRSDSMF